MKKNNSCYNQTRRSNILLREVLRIVMFFELLFIFPFQGFAQTPKEGTEKIEIQFADSLAIMVNHPVYGETRKLIGSVRLKHKGSLMYCDTAIQYLERNAIEAYSRVKIVQGDTVTVSGDTLYYYGDTRLAIMMGKNTQLKDLHRTLSSQRLEYDMQAGIASYKTPGVTVDQADTLRSATGFYNVRTKEYTYYKDVKLVDPKYTLTTDTLIYHSLTKWSYFRGHTVIENKDGRLVGRKGRHNSETGESVFDTRTTVDNAEYTLTGDSLYFDDPGQKGYAKGNVEIVSKKDSTILMGDEGEYRGNEGFSRVFGHALVKSVLSQDTLFIRADTLYSKENRPDSTRTLIAEGNVYIYKSDFQGICDSLTYLTADSVIQFFKKPVLWGDQNQMESDTVTAWIVNNRIRRMLLHSNSFVIAEDTLISQYNQIKGRSILTYFDEQGKVKDVVVDGNGESVYYALDDGQQVIGLNRVLCGKMNIKFKENRVDRIAFIGRPDGKLIPPHEIKVTERQLDGFNWRISEKPTKQQTTWQAESAPVQQGQNEL